MHGVMTWKTRYCDGTCNRPSYICGYAHEGEPLRCRPFQLISGCTRASCPYLHERKPESYSQRSTSQVYVKDHERDVVDDQIDKIDKKINLDRDDNDLHMRQYNISAWDRREDLLQEKKDKIFHGIEENLQKGKLPGNSQGESRQDFQWDRRQDFQWDRKEDQSQDIKYKIPRSREDKRNFEISQKGMLDDRSDVSDTEELKRKLRNPSGSVGVLSQKEFREFKKLKTEVRKELLEVDSKVKTLGLEMEISNSMSIEWARNTVGELYEPLQNLTDLSKQTSDLSKETRELFNELSSHTERALLEMNNKIKSLSRENAELKAQLLEVQVKVSSEKDYISL